VKEAGGTQHRAADDPAVLFPATGLGVAGEWAVNLWTKPRYSVRLLFAFPSSDGVGGWRERIAKP